MTGARRASSGTPRGSSWLPQVRERGGRAGDGESGRVFFCLVFSLFLFVLCWVCLFVSLVVVLSHLALAESPVFGIAVMPSVVVFPVVPAHLLLAVVSLWPPAVDTSVGAKHPAAINRARREEKHRPGCSTKRNLAIGGRRPTKHGIWEEGRGQAWLDAHTPSSSFLRKNSQPACLPACPHPCVPTCCRLSPFLPIS